MAQTNANLIWKIADLLRGPYQPNQYGDVILPFTILRRLDCILEPTKDEVLTEYKKIASTKVDPGVLLKAKFKLPFYNTSRWTFASLVGDPEGVADNLVDYIEHFSSNVRDVFDGFRMMDQIADLAKSDPAVSDRQRVRRRRSAPQGRVRTRHGAHLRRTHPQVRRVQLHPGG
jgi:type I restriction enzyme M protein